MRRIWVIGAALAVCACDDGQGDPAPTGPTLAELQAALLTPSCSFDACHGGPNPKNGLDLTTLDASYAGLVDTSTKAGDSVRVKPGDAAGSQLVRTLRGAVGEVRQMPLGFTLSEDAIGQVEAWIAAGAPKGDAGDVTDVEPITPEANEELKPEDLPPPMPSEGFQMGIDTVAPAGEEIWKCWVGDLPTTGLTSINRVESIQTRGVHHMDIMALGLLGLPIEPGMHDCQDLYDAHAEMMERGIFLFASQNETETLQLPEGIAAGLPGGLQIMVEMHYVNPTPRDVDVFSRINAYTIPSAEVTGQIWGWAVRDSDIAIPPQTERHIEWTRCVMNKDIDMLILSTHTHQLAELADVYLFDGERTGEKLYENWDWHAPQLLQFDPPMTIPAGTGFEFRCHYRNPTDTEVNWGFGAEDEMCQIGLVFTPLDLTAECEVVDSGVRTME